MDCSKKEGCWCLKDGQGNALHYGPTELQTWLKLFVGKRPPRLFEVKDFMVMVEELRNNFDYVAEQVAE